MVHSLAVIALPQLFPNDTGHHRLDPLLADDGVLGRFKGFVVGEVDALEGGWDLRLLGEERGGFGDGHG